MRKKYKIFQNKDTNKNEAKIIDSIKINYSKYKKQLTEKKNVSNIKSNLDFNNSDKKSNEMQYNHRYSVKYRKYQIIKKEENIRNDNKVEINKSLNLANIDDANKQNNNIISTIDSKKYRFQIKKRLLSELNEIAHPYQSNRMRNSLYNKQTNIIMNTDPNNIKSIGKEKEKEKEDLIDIIRKNYKRRRSEKREKKTNEANENKANEEIKKKILFEEDDEEKKITTRTIDSPRKKSVITSENYRTIEKKKNEGKYKNNSDIKESSKIFSLLKKCKNKPINNSSNITNTHKNKKLNNEGDSNTINNDDKSKDKFPLPHYNTEKKDSYIDAQSTNSSRNKVKSTFNFLIHQAHENTNLSNTFNKMYERYINYTSNKKNKNKCLTIDEKDNSEVNQNGLSLNENNSCLNSITNLIKEFGYEKNKKNDLKIKNINLPLNEDKSDKKMIRKSNLRNLLEISPKNESSQSNIDNNKNKDLNKDESFNITNKIVNNNTFNTTYNIYKINNTISRKDFSSKKDFSSEIKEKNIKLPNINEKAILNSNNKKYKKYYKVIINNNDIKKEEDNKLIHRNSDPGVGPFMNKQSKNIQEIIINQQIINTNIVNIEIIYLLETKIKSILNKINNYDICFNECQDWIFYYFNNNVYDLIINLFKNKRNKNSMNNKIKIEILCYFLCYDASFSKNFSQAGILLKTIFQLLHNNFLLLITYALNNFTTINDINSNIFNTNLINNLNQIINKELKLNLSIQEIHNENCIIEIIEQNYKQIDNYYKMIIDNLYHYFHMPSLSTSGNKSKDDINNNKIYKFPQCLFLDIDKLNNNQKLRIISLFFFDAYKLLNNYNILDLKIFFDLFLNKQINKNENVYNNKIIQKLIYGQKNNYNNEYYKILRNSFNLNNNSKYLLPQIKSYYEYSLLINLDILLYNNEYSKIVNINKDKNKKIILRRGLLQFLQEMKQIYELILFSNNSFDYITKVLKSFEKNEKLFEYILSNNQISFDKKGSISNIESLGRNLSHIIILDKDQSLLKENNSNIIKVKPFYGDVNNDGNILNNLTDLLKKIKYDMEEIDDIRISIANHRLEIFTKISTNLI